MSFIHVTYFIHAVKSLGSLQPTVKPNEAYACVLNENSAYATISGHRGSKFGIELLNLDVNEVHKSFGNHPPVYEEIML